MYDFAESWGTEAKILQQFCFNCLSNFSSYTLSISPQSDIKNLNDSREWKAGGGEGTSMKITLIYQSVTHTGPKELQGCYQWPYWLLFPQAWTWTFPHTSGESMLSSFPAC